MESASGGLPGWIQNFVISLVQREELNIMMLSRFEAQKLGAVMPSPAMLQVKSTSQRTDDFSMKMNSENVSTDSEGPSPRTRELRRISTSIVGFSPQIIRLKYRRYS